MSVAKVGDRIELVRMADDPDPVRPGTRGTVDYVSRMMNDGRNRPYWQVGVKWDDGRGLMLVVPPDLFRFVEEEQ